MGGGDEILTVSEVAAELRCSKAHAYIAIAGRIPGVSRLPAICMGRRKLVRRSTFEQWKNANEKPDPGGMISPSPEVHAVGRMEGKSHA
jgi:hypothetical protein